MTKRLRRTEPQLRRDKPSKAERLALVVALAALLPALSAAAGVSTTRHNLSVSGPGAVKADTESRICIFCHTPHTASTAGPLWNRRDPGGPFTPYSSSTAIAAPGQPTGASLLCLSCHDGTIALGEVSSEAVPIPMAGGVTTIPSGPGRLGTDLSDDHPVSFVYDDALASLDLKYPKVDKLRLKELADARKVLMAEK